MQKQSENEICIIIAAIQRACASQIEEFKATKVVNGEHRRTLWNLGKTDNLQQKDLISNFHVLWQLIDCNLNDRLLDSPTMLKVMDRLDASTNRMLSGCSTARTIEGWCDAEGSDFRILWGYFVRLSLRSAWSTSKQVIRLKSHFVDLLSATKISQAASTESEAGPRRTS